MAKTQEESKAKPKADEAKATAATATASRAVAKKRARTKPEPRPCACGCGAATRGAWAPGHDARLWAIAHKYESGKLEADEAKAALAAFPPATLKANRDKLLAIAPEVPLPA